MRAERIPELPPIPQAYTVRQVMKLLAIGRTKVWALMKDGDLRARRLGHRIIVFEPDLKAYIASLRPYSDDEAA